MVGRYIRRISKEVQVSLFITYCLYFSAFFFFFFTPYLLSKHFFFYIYIIQESLAAANQVAEERFSNIRVVKTFGHEKYEYSLYSKKLGDVLQLAYSEAKIRALFFGLVRHIRFGF